MEIPDPVIRKNVESIIRDDPVLASSDINVEVMNGVVILRGRVKSDEAKKSAINDALSIPGISGVNAEYLRTL